MIENNHTEWLPLVPGTWHTKDPRVTVLSSGLLTISVVAAISATDGPVEVGQGMQINLIPKDWDEEKIAFFQRRFNALGKTWGAQPYDLRSRPLNLPNVVPDPYLESRPTEYSNPSQLDDDLKDQLKRYTHDTVIEENDKRTPKPCVSLCLPTQNIGKGSYSAALGRSFFISRHGYMGLAPPDAQVGGKVVLLDARAIPFHSEKHGAGGKFLQATGRVVHGEFS